MKIKNILAVGGLNGRARQRVNALERLGYNVDRVNETLQEQLDHSNFSFLDKVFYKLGYPRDKDNFNQRLLSAIQKKQYDLLWIEKTLLLKPSVLKKIRKNNPKLIITWYSEDNMFERHNQSNYFRKTLPLYDLFFTTKSYNCNPEELPSLGVKHPVFVWKAYDKIEHSPIALSEGDIARFGADVGFAGTFEQDRAEKMLFLAENGIDVRVWGNGWDSWIGKHHNLRIENRPVYGEEYRKTLCATKINLCFLRKMNRDLQTDRSIEIPACGAFMLAERTEEHRALFTEDVEAVYFDTENLEEFLEKVRYYLSHEKERSQIALAGRRRCLESDYSHENRLREMLSACGEF